MRTPPSEEIRVLRGYVFTHVGLGLSGTRRCTWRFRADELDGAMLGGPSAAKNGESFDATGK